ncbi:MAG TPA: L,D-transpeptidase family protein, partial [Actinomycetota bacterium]|nr:L,D-transpeptidase family protein [Actinomycetota bacterium]
MRVARAKHRRGRGAWVVAGVVVASLAVVSAGTVYAASRYDAAASDRILPGVSIAGVDVSGMRRGEAVRTIREVAEETLFEELTVRAAGTSWTVTPASLGMVADVEGAVDEAFAAADEMSFFSRLYHRLRNVPVEHEEELSFVQDPAGVEEFVQQAFDEVAVPAVNARFALVEDELVLRRSSEGRELAVGPAAKKILLALERRANDIEVPVRTVEPFRSTASLGESLVVDLSENQLYLYDGLKVVKTYQVATAAAGYATPVGTWEVVDKRENPTWYNPALDTWGADLPAVIPPGPGNPLGTRALYLNAPGIRIHGTYSADSIGTYASHGCVRMFLEDSEELYELVP